jgi:LmbE family N-acetylglucosaminyl deacetylase
MIVISPHLDDAVLSCGQWLADEGERARVVTVFAGQPVMNGVTVFDAHSGFESSREAVAARWREDYRAMSVLGTSMPTHLQYLDGQYEQPRNADAIHAELMSIVTDAFNDGHNDRRLLIPVGIGHPDHVDVREIAMDIGIRLADETWLYEELPYRVLHPGTVEPVVEFYGGFDLEPRPAGAQLLKAAAVMCYASQLWALDLACCLVPERFWLAR